MKNSVKYNVYDVSIIGAGVGGLSTANLLQLKGKKSLLIESHYYTGGCAGYFKRREGYYDVGATTFSGVKDSRPLSLLLDQLNVDIGLQKEKIGIKAFYNGESFSYHSDKNAFIKEVSEKFGYDGSHFINKIIRIEKQLWVFLSKINDFPNITIKDFLTVINFIPFFVKNYKIFYQSFFQYLPKGLRKNEKFITYIDQMLMISTQQKSKRCPAFIGIIGFLYPSDTYSAKKGMYGLCQSLNENFHQLGGNLKLKEKVLKIEKRDKLFHIKTNKSTYVSKKVVFNTPPKVTAKILDSNCGNDFKMKSVSQGEIWGAMTAYFSFKTDQEVENKYQQVILTKEEQKIFKTESLFFSFSHLNEKGQIRVTVSTHVDKSLFHEKDSKYYDTKEDFKKLVISIFDKYIEVPKVTEFKFDSVSTPLTWHYYTNRPQGEVGGLRHNSILSLLKLLPNQMNEEYYCVGDYSFPGQGIVSVVQGAYNIETKF